MISGRPPTTPRDSDLICTNVRDEDFYETMTYGDALSLINSDLHTLYEEGYDYIGVYSLGIRDVFGQERQPDGSWSRVRLRGPYRFRRGACVEPSFGSLEEEEEEEFDPDFPPVDRIDVTFPPVDLDLDLDPDTIIPRAPKEFSFVPAILCGFVAIASPIVGWAHRRLRKDPVIG